MPRASASRPRAIVVSAPGSNLRMRALVGISLLLSLLLLASSADAGWEKVKAYLQPRAEIVEETDERIVLRSGSGESAIELVVTVGWAPDSDVYGDIAMRDGANPYRIWVVSERLASDQTRPRAEWGRVLRADFLRILRQPRTRDVAR